MLTEKEKHGISELLMRMNTKDLASLAQTVTSRLIIPETSGEAVHAILLHTDRPSDLLRRRKVKKEFLFKYLHAKRVSVDASADKSIFISAVLQLWGCSGSNSVVIHEEDSLPEAPAPSRNTSYSSLCSLDYGSQLCLGLGGLNTLPLNLDLHSNDTNSSCGSPKTRRRRFTAAMTPPPIRISGSYDNLDTMDDFEERVDVAVPSSSSDHADAMADSFVKWFYSMINSTLFNPDSAAEFGPQHFWVDASAKISLQEGSALTNQQFISVSESAEEVSAALKDIVQKYRLTFNPNMTREGVSGMIDPHGLALVTACGTLHNPSTSRCCGTFHQQFGLIRDPGLGNNWKIKFTNASLISREGVSETPCLTNLTASEGASMVLS